MPGQATRKTGQRKTPLRLAPNNSGVQLETYEMIVEELRQIKFKAALEKARLIPLAINKRHAKQQWAEAMRQYLKAGRQA